MCVCVPMCARVNIPNYASNIDAQFLRALFEGAQVDRGNTGFPSILFDNEEFNEYLHSLLIFLKRYWNVENSEMTMS